MATRNLGELVRLLHDLPVAAFMTELRTHTLVAVNEGAAAVVGAPADELIGGDVLTYIDPPDRDAARAAYSAMANKVIDGYQAERRVVTSNGRAVPVNVWGRRVEAPDRVYGLWILTPTSGPPADLDALVMGAATVVLAVTDHDWQIEYMSADTELLGAHGSELRRFPLLGLVHPSAANEFLAAASQASADRLAVTILTRMRAGENWWSDRYCLMVPICDHQPPRLGVVISAGPSSSEAASADGAIEEQVRQAAIEARASTSLEALPSLAGLPRGSELSARQTEIVARLISGQRVPAIAQSMFLSASTVRNHLSAIYRKFGVHSQAQLLAALLRPEGWDH